ncbi:MAG: pyridoxal phosphate-dependent aminotransferase [Sphingobacteriia bacterium]|nr:pyridoxal phosphate-dependent aminotransferase [Sphingobacteriia bacterium]
MPSISTRGLAMPASPIRKLVPYAEAARKKGTKVYHLNIGQPDIPTPESFLEAIRNTSIKVLEYSHSAGNESYRKKLLGYYQKFNIQFKLEDIMITTGGSEALRFAFMACLNPGDEVIIPEPFYANYNGFAVEAGITVVPVTSTIESGFALPSISEFESLITPKTKAILICNPGNPTGKLYTLQELEGLRDLVLKNNLYLFSDEVYKEFCYDGASFHSVFHLPGLEENTIVLDSISKRYSACGARIGCLISRNRAVMESALKFAQARLSPPTFEQIGAEAALETPDSYFEEVKEEYTQRRNLVVHALNQMPGVFCPLPGGAFYAVVKLPIDDSDEFCQWLLESFSFEGATVMLAPASGFYATPGMGKQEVRLAYVLNQEDLTKAMTCLAEGLKAYASYKANAIVK